MLPNPNLTIDQHILLLPLIARAVNGQPDSQIKPKTLNTLVSEHESDFPQLQNHQGDRVYLAKLSKDNFEFYVEMGFLSKDGKKYFSTQQLINWFQVYEQDQDEALSQFVDALAATSFAQAVANGTFSTQEDVLHLIWNAADLRDPEDEAAINATHATFSLLEYYHLIPAPQASETDHQEQNEQPPPAVSGQRQEFDTADDAQDDPDEPTNENIDMVLGESTGETDDYGQSSHELNDDAFQDESTHSSEDDGETHMLQNDTSIPSTYVEGDKDATYYPARTDVTHQSSSGVYDATQPHGIDQDELRNRAAEAGYSVETGNPAASNASNDTPVDNTPVSNDPFSGLVGFGSRPGRRRRIGSGKPKRFVTVDPEEIASGDGSTEAGSTPAPGSAPPKASQASSMFDAVGGSAQNAMPSSPSGEPPASPADRAKMPDSRDSTPPGAGAFTTDDGSTSERPETDTFANDGLPSVSRGQRRRLSASPKKTDQQPEAHQPAGKRPKLRLGGDGTSAPVARPSSVDGSTRPPSRRLRKRDLQAEDTAGGSATKKRDSQRISKPEKKSRTSHSRIGDGNSDSRRRRKAADHGDDSSKRRPMIRIQQDSIEMDVDAMEQLARMSPEDAEQLRRNLDILKDDTQHDDED